NLREDHGSGSFYPAKIALVITLAVTTTMNARSDPAAPIPYQGQEMPNQGYRMPENPANVGKPNRRPDLSRMKADVINIKQGFRFLEQNKLVEGVVTLPSGLQYKVLKQGDGPKPLPTDSVEVYYLGSLLDGVAFANHLSESGIPQAVLVSETIPAWRQALTLMATGSKWQLFVPGELGFGNAGSPPLIGPNATLVYELELVKILPPKNKPNSANLSKLPSKPGEPANLGNK
ncbi:MAG: FKBP-type peptidyl-prolyl cis-trans isomerase, partial [Candidatus Methylumidiphilus sp.]